MLRRGTTPPCINWRRTARSWRPWTSSRRSSMTRTTSAGSPRDKLPYELLGEVLRGGADIAKEAGAFVVGGHSVDDPEPKYGMVAIGEVHPNRIVTLAKARAGDALVLTKPIGTGVLSTALKRDLASAADIAPAVTSMTTLNAGAARAMRATGGGVHAATDVTGFGLLGHLHNMLMASNVAAEI